MNGSRAGRALLRKVTALGLVPLILTFGSVGSTTRARAEEKSPPVDAGDAIAVRESPPPVSPLSAGTHDQSSLHENELAGSEHQRSEVAPPTIEHVSSSAGGGQAGPLSFQLPVQPRATVDESSGALVYEYPIELPEGRNRMTPELSLRYNSRGVGNLGSFTGLGWELSLPSIQREPIRGTQALYETAFFSAALSGHLIADSAAAPAAVFRPEVDDGSYRRYVFRDDGSWTVTGKEGWVWFYGETDESRQNDPSDPSRVYRWMLSRVEDRHGNEITFVYEKDQGQIYPTKISYTLHPSSVATHTVSFVYTSPSGFGDTSYQSDFPVVTARLLSKITVATTVGSDTATDTYAFQYDEAQFLNQKLLTSIERTTNFPHAEYVQQFDNVTSFSYSSKQPGWEQGTHTLEGYLSYRDDQIFRDIYTADFDRNGYPDILVSYAYHSTVTNYLLLNTGSSFVDATTSWALPTNLDLSDWYAIADINGDHLPDLHPRNFGNLLRPVYLNTGSGFVADSSGTWLMDTYVPEVQGCGPNVGDSTSYSTNSFLYDIDRDGRPDIVYFGGPAGFKVFLNTGQGWTRSFAYTFTAPPGSPYNFSRSCEYPYFEKNYQALIDMNGDGLEDYVHAAYGTYLNTGHGFTYYAPYSLNQQEDMDRSGLADINGDGLTDFISFKAYDGGNRCALVLLNNGAGFTLVNPSTFPPCTNSGIWNPNELKYVLTNPATFGTLMDVTGDGLPDVVGPFYNSTLGKVRAISDGRQAWTQVSFVQDPWEPIVTPSHGVFFDINIDGVLDFIAPELAWDGHQQSPSKVYMGNPSVPNRLVAITSALGATTRIEYATAATDWSDTNISPIPVVSTLKVESVGWGQPDMVTHYEYSGGAYAADQLTGQRRFAGFHAVTARESGADLVPLRTEITYFHQANGSDAATAEPADAELALIGKPYYSLVQDPSGTARRETWTKYGTYGLTSDGDLGRHSTFVFPSAVTTKTSDADVESSTAIAYAYNVACGELAEEDQLGFVTAEPDGSYEDIPGDSRYRFRSYATNTDGTIVKLVREDIRTSPEEQATVARTEYRYDGEPFGSVGDRGNLTLESKWVSGNGEEVASTSYTYDDFGNVLTTTNPRGALTTYTYDATQSLVGTETNALGHVRTFEYLVGKPTSLTDANGNVTSYGYSTKGWLYRTTTPKNAGSQRTRQFLDGHDPGDWRIETATQLVHGQEDRSWQLFDNLGRPVRLVRERLNHSTGTPAGFFLKEARGYDSLGREVTRSAPLGTPNFVGPSYAADQPVPAALMTATAYDVFDRPLTVTDALGATSLSYAGPWMTIVDPNGKVKNTRVDAYENLVEVREHNGPDTYATSYAYDLRNLLVKLTDALGNVRDFGYDNAGWLRSSEDLHASGDADFGLTSFTYDLAGNQVTETKPDGTVVTRVYDDLNRVTAILDSTDPYPTNFTLAYDTCSGGKGRLCEVTGSYPNSSSVSLRKTFVYGPSAPSSMTLRVLTSTFSTSYQYTLSDEVEKVTHPDGTKVRYVFGDRALPEKVYVTLPGSTETLFATAGYHHTGEPESIAFSNGVTFAYAYDDAKLYRKSGFTANFGETLLQSFAYSYDNTNNVTQVVEPGVTKKYAYDDLYRLIHATYWLSPSRSGVPANSACDPTPVFRDSFESGDTSCWGGGGSNVVGLDETHSYNAIGNIVSVNGVPYSYSGLGKANPHATTSIGAASYAYDSNGNMIAAPGLELTYDWQNQPTGIRRSDGVSIFAAYDDTGRRLWYESLDDWEVTVSDDYLVRQGGVEITIDLGNLAVGLLLDGTTYVSVSDHLGTPVKQVGSGGMVAERSEYGPFGALVESTGSIKSKRGYTGHQEDTETGLVYAGARHYNPTIRRFLQQDPSHVYLGHQSFAQLIGGDRASILDDPQQLNSYSYVRNNPATLRDATGKCIEDVCIGEALIITAPLWVPAVGALAMEATRGATKVATYLKNRGRPRLQVVDPSRFSFNPKNQGPKGKWILLGAVAALVDLTVQVAGDYVHYADFAHELGMRMRESSEREVVSKSLGEAGSNTAPNQSDSRPAALRSLLKDIEWKLKELSKRLHPKKRK